jgi:outer membrane autotransporter protein
MKKSFLLPLSLLTAMGAHADDSLTKAFNETCASDENMTFSSNNFFNPQDLVSLPEPESTVNTPEAKAEDKPAEGKKVTKDATVVTTKNGTVVAQPVMVYPMMAAVQSFGMTDALVQQSMRGSSMFAASAERLFANREQALDQAVAGVSSGDSMVQGLDMWVEGTMGRLSRKAMANHSKLKQDTAALAAGVGVALTDRTTVGVALSRGDSTSRQGVAKSQAEQTDVSLYGLTALTDRFYTSGTIGTGVIENRDRIISNVATGAAQRAKYRTKGHHASAEFGYSQPAMEGRATINPYVSLSVLQLDAPRVTYRDVAGREVMTMAGKKQTFTTAKLGVRGALLVLDRVALEGHAEWQQAVGSKSTTLQARTLTASGRTTDQTLRLGHVSDNSMNAGVAVVASLSKDADVRVGYDVEKGRRFVGHRGNVSLRFRF